MKTETLSRQTALEPFVHKNGNGLRHTAAKSRKLTTRQIKNLETRIREKLRETHEDIKILNGSISEELPTQPYSSSIADNADGHAEREKIVRESNHLLKLCRALEDALTAIKNGTYGICTVCGGNIPYNRMAATLVAKQHCECK